MYAASVGVDGGKGDITLSVFGQAAMRSRAGQGPVPEDSSIDLPAQDVAKAGGWATVSMVTDLYQKADEATMLAVVLDRGELREVQG